MPERSFHEALQVLTAKEPIPYEEIADLYQKHVPRVVRHQLKLSTMTYEAMEHLSVCTILNVLIPIPVISGEYLEYLFWVHTIGCTEYEDLATVLRSFATYRYEIFEQLVTKVAILEDVHEKYPDILDRLKQSAEA